MASSYFLQYILSPIAIDLLNSVLTQALHLRTWMYVTVDVPNETITWVFFLFLVARALKKVSIDNLILKLRVTEKSIQSSTETYSSFMISSDFSLVLIA